MAIQGFPSELGADSSREGGHSSTASLPARLSARPIASSASSPLLSKRRIAGRGERLKEFVVGVEVFGKDDSFDPRNDPSFACRPAVCVRSWRATIARRAREDDLAIDLPKGGYAPVFRPLKGRPRRNASIAPALVSRNTVLVLAFCRSQLGRRSGVFLPGLTQEIIHPCRDAKIRL